jgi:zinc-ribbon domain
MDNQLQQRFCTNCGQPVAPGTAFCVACGAPVGTPPVEAAGQPPAGAQPEYAPPSMPSMQSPAQPQQSQDDLLMAALAAGMAANQAGQNRQQGRRSRGRLSGCGCLLLMLVVLAGPFIGFVMTTGRLHVIFAYAAGGLVLLFLLLVLIGMLATRSGRETLADGCLDAILGGIFGGG